MICRRLIRGSRLSQKTARVARAWSEDSEQPSASALARQLAADDILLAALDDQPLMSDADMPAAHVGSQANPQTADGVELAASASTAMTSPSATLQRRGWSQATQQHPAHLQSQLEAEQTSLSQKLNQHPQEQPNHQLPQQVQRQLPSPLVVHMDANPLASELRASDIEGLRSGGLISSAVVTFHLGLCQLDALQLSKDAPESWLFMHPSFFTELKE